MKFSSNVFLVSHQCCVTELQAISTHYASSHCHYIDIAGTTQEIVAREVSELVDKRLGPDTGITYQVRGLYHVIWICQETLI